MDNMDNMDIQSTIAAMSIEDKISLCTGADFWRSKAMERYGIPAFVMSDGPHGLRYQSGEPDMIGINESDPATCFPAAVTAGAAWNPALFAAEGEAIGREAVRAGVDVVLGPGCNIKRNPLCGRNFEYISEDPYLTGKLAAAYIQGQQAAGVSSSLKHFAANNQEYKRQSGDSQVDGRALREIYLAPFETAVKEGRPGTVMCAYNRLNGVFASDNRWLLTEVLREEWGFDGLVLTDWGALHDRLAAFRAGCELNMPGGSRYMERAALEAVREGTLSEADIDRTVERIIRFALDCRRRRTPGDFDADAHDVAAHERAVQELEAHEQLACAIAEQGAVLLKNQDRILPAAPEDMVLIGYMAKRFRYQGTGSSHINPTRLSSLTDTLPGVPYCVCCGKDGSVTEPNLRLAVQMAKRAKVAVVVAGLPDSYESESIDREHMRLPEGHNRMIEAVAAANPNTVVVLLGGSAMELPWAGRVKGILYMGLSGQAGGRACANLLTGKANPSGKLTETWPLRYGDVISGETFGARNVEYRESIYVGYRYYDKAEVPVRFPFGHGLSYTRFTYSGLKIRGRTVTATVTNTGNRAGAEVVQLYIAPPRDGLHRPVKELKGFARVELQPGESRQIRFELDGRSFAVWADGWKIPGGRYEVLLAASSRDIRLRGSLHVRGESVPAPAWQKGSWYETCSGLPNRVEWERAMGGPVPRARETRRGQYTLDDSCFEMKDHALVMKFQYKVIEAMLARRFDGKRDLSNPDFRLLMTCATDGPLRASVICAGNILPESLARGMVEMANGRYLRGLRTLLKR